MNKYLVRAYRALPFLCDFLRPKSQQRILEKTGLWRENTLNTLSANLSPPAIAAITLQRDPKLPKLAWIATITQSGDVTIRHGEKVETVGEGFFEGVWAGAFSDGDFRHSHAVFGSGLTVTPDALVFTPPTAVSEAIYVLQNHKTGEFILSNSLLGAISALPQDMAENLANKLAPVAHLEALRMTKRGVLDYDPFVCNHDNISVYFWYHHNLCLKRNGVMDIEIKVQPEQFRSFAGYKKFLLDKISEIKDNGSSPERKFPLSALNTISSGYDSAATTALCVDVGIKKSCTLDAVINGRNDSGAHIAAILGSDCSPFPHPLGPVIDNLNATLDEHHLEQMDIFLATTGRGDDYPMLAFSSILADHMLFTGAGGDGFWATNCLTKPGFCLSLGLEVSYTEFRLSTGFAVVPVPILGAVFPDSIHTLSHRSEMRAWRIGGHYDRPIPRRILEERGVPRASFGFKKSGVNPVTPNHANRKPVSFTKILRELYSKA